MAVVEIETAVGTTPKAYRLLFANDTFRRLTSLHPEANWLEVSFLSRLSLADQAVLRERFRRHFLNALLGYVYGKANLVSSRLLHEPLVVAFPDPETAEVHQIELSLRAPESGLQLTAVDATLVNALAAQWPTPPQPRTGNGPAIVPPL
ncbi:MAG: hypothetical protein HC922_01610 [Leptolyngbyaceae cyanobacterium SM2_3_12]|nr:hypothetical protein [Leptolyngbyaceae cyanobacterium SM2_3_12]